MTFAFFSNFLNHHQLPLCLAWREALGDNFTFVAMQPFDGGEVAASYQDMNKAHPFCLAAYESSEATARARKLADESDVVLYGATAPALFWRRIAADRLTFRYSERIFKPYYTPNMAYTHACAMWECLRCARRENTWLLAAGGYAAHDYAKVGGFHGRALRWGYFPAVDGMPHTIAPENTVSHATALSSGAETMAAMEYERYGQNKQHEAQENNVLELLWAGRMIAYKHAERVIPFLQALQKEGILFSLTLAGDGALRGEWERLFAPFGDSARFAGTLTVPQTRALMRQSDIFLFTSDESEGWGAVLSEAMADGCAVLASDACGASAYLIQDAENGVLFADGDELDFVTKGLALARCRPKREQMGQKAAVTMRNTWNADVAALRFLQVSGALLAGKPLPEWPDGPCSKDACLAHKHRRKL